MAKGCERNEITMARYEVSDIGNYEISSFPLKKLFQLPRAITKAIESLVAPFEQLSLDGAAAYETVMSVSSGYNLYEKYVVLDLNDLEHDDIGAVQGFLSLCSSTERTICDRHSIVD